MPLSTPIQLGIIMDPIEQIDYQKDSTLAMCWEANIRGWDVYYLSPTHLYQQQDSPYVTAAALKTFQNPNHWYELGEPCTLPLDHFDIILMRKDPPFNMQYIYTTFFLENAQTRGVKIINRPESLRSCNEKLFPLKFPTFCPPSLVSHQLAPIKSFQKAHGTVILKPLDGMGGRGIFKISPNGENLAACVEMLSEKFTVPIITQAFIPEVALGDKRILMVNGNPIPYALARIPQEGDIRANLAAGGRGEGQPLSQRDQDICQAVGPMLRQLGIVFAGLDVIGDYITEINITSPTCIRELDQQFGLNIAGTLFDAIEEDWV